MIGHGAIRGQRHEPHLAESSSLDFGGRDSGGGESIDDHSGA